MKPIRREECANCEEVRAVDFMAEVAIHGFDCHNMKTKIIHRWLCLDCYQKFMDAMKINGEEVEVS